MAINVKQTGGILLLALIFCATSSICLLLILETGILEILMSRHHQQKKQMLIEYIAKLHTIEMKLEEHKYDQLPKEVTFLQWVPDSLKCNEPEGLQYYQIRSEQSTFDEANSQYNSIYAVRGPLPAGLTHPNMSYCGKDYQSLIIPLSKRLPIANFVGEFLIGLHPEDKGVLLYVRAQKKYHLGQVLLIINLIDDIDAQLLKVIDTETHLYQPILRNHKLIINNNEWVMLIEPFSGEMLQRERLQPSSYSSPINENALPIIMKQKQRAPKHLILCPTSNGWSQAEVILGLEEVGRKAWHEV